MITGPQLPLQFYLCRVWFGFLPDTLKNLQFQVQPATGQSGVSREQFAVVCVPRSRSRHRFAAGCVDTVDSSQQAVELADPKARKFAAIVIGPSKSSEGQIIYYLVRWLAQQP